ncbi:sigma 54-interacting transcriptional regulator [Enterococcus sp. BWM-S5]|uniref:Sigma 54-interacting transcriptional regulator n=1 Tax=Enterococcus larvae TaxID=2794352 RepID=A0ABS4CIL0_9ENTE|nr:sigma 54-interacting transcriptional regulator [Enterococcus larvae]
MGRIETIHDYIKKLPQGTAVSAQDIANHLHIDRANASSDLNTLVKQELLKKEGSRPVLFSLPVHQQKSYVDAFSQKNPSLKNSLEQAKAAVLYPPQRMHILLSGQTGVGKSMFAELIYKFSQEQDRIAAAAKLVTFNCADYASNPQLILGQLFGVLEGAYTGAVTSRRGLIEEADGGILFLDEVHRLSPEAQEMLFTFIDKKVFHALGETTFGRTADVQLICATTEEISSSLLQTFTRRIPMKIHLPALEERGLNERLNLITDFFNEEAHNLNRDIKVSMNSLRSLLSYDCLSNIGQLKTDVQLLCAQSYARSLSSKQDALTITSYDLPESIKEGLYSTEKRSDLWKLTASYSTRFVDFQKDKENQLPFSENEAHDIYQLIDHKITDMEKIGLNAKATKEVVDMTIQDFFQSLSAHAAASNESVVNLVGNEIFSTAKRFLTAAATHTDSYSDSILSGLAIHLHNLLPRIKNGQRIINPKLEEIKTQQHVYYQIAEKNRTIIENDLAIELPEDEIGFLTLFLVPQIIDEEAEKVKVLVVAHGEATASSMADLVNELLGNQAVIAFNMPLTCKPRSILAEIQAYLMQIQNNTILLLSDMGSLTNFADELKKSTSKQLKCVDLVSTLHVLEASRKAQLGYALDEIVTDIKRITHMEDFSQIGQTVASKKKSFVLTACTTGSGSARLLKELLNKQLNLYDEYIEIRSLQITDEAMLEEAVKDIRQQGDILCYVSTFKITALHCPYFNVSQAFNTGTLERIQQLIDFDYTSSLAIQNVAPMIQSLDGTILLENVKNWINAVEYQLILEITPEIKIGLMCHLASVIDSLKRSDELLIDHEITLETEKEQLLYNELRSLEMIYGITFSQENFEHILAYVFKQKFAL